MDDETLISTFIDSFFRGRTVMVSNRHLRTEMALGKLQLLSQGEGVVATAQLEAPLQIWVRQTTRFKPLLNRLLMAQEFFPLLDPQMRGCDHYRRYAVLAGYTPACTLARELWRSWWSHRSRSRSGLPLDLLLLCRGPHGAAATWYPIRDVECAEGILVLKTLAGKIQTQLDDQVVWLRKIDPKETPTSSRQLRPDLRGHYRLQQ